MTNVTEQMLGDTEVYIQGFFEKNIPSKFVFHDLEHTAQTVSAAKAIGEGFELIDKDLILLQLAAWFHDTGYYDGPESHEERSCQVATEYFKDKMEPADLETICGCIRATKVPQRPETNLQKIIGDADLSHLGMKSYWDRNGKFRQELILTKNQVMNEQDWIEFEINFMINHQYHTSVAQSLFNKRKAKHVQQLVKQKRRLSPNHSLTDEEIALINDPDTQIDLKKVLGDTEKDLTIARMGRGVETMYRTTYSTHTNLSRMADSKANMMISVNAIVISIIFSRVVPDLQGKIDIYLIVPMVFLMITCLGSMIFATLSTRPKVTEGRVTLESIKQRKANLLFFGNYYNMKLEDFQYGINEMIKDPDFLYSTMSRDLYYLGIVLAVKYKYLSYCYNIFMYGLIGSVLAFGVSFAIKI